MSSFTNKTIHKLIKLCYRFTLMPFVKVPNNRKLRETHERIVSLHNSHQGERCFIVGNGPSLKTEDLLKIKDIPSFASNRIYEIYDSTDWRPTFYCIQDYKLIKKHYKTVNQKVDDIKYVGMVKSRPYPKIENAVFLNLIWKEYKPNPAPFSEDIADCIYGGSTITYMCLQMAIYMGFKEIYLLGIDHNYSIMIDENGQMVKQENLQDHFSKNDQIENIPHLDNSTLAYKAARQYADSHGIKIYNATRGGKLEVFERIDFDRFIENKLGGEKR